MLTGQLANALDVAAAPGYAIHGLGFYGGDRYVSLNAPPAGGRLARFSDPDAGGIYRTRHDFVYSIPTKTPGVNQIQIVGSTLYVGIGAASRTGVPRSGECLHDDRGSHRRPNANRLLRPDR